MSRADAAVLLAYYLTLGILGLYSIHRLYLVRLRRRYAGRAVDSIDHHVWPSLTVQLPLYNEPNVAARLVDAAARLEYGGALDIQLLDDSTDATSAIIAARVERWRSRGVRIAHLRRASREGFKAGALAEGMRRSNAELFAVFDADFVPMPDTLLRMVPHFARPEVGMVQARWEHLNREQSLLTRVQAIYLDAHFAIESAARHLSGRFFNFNGTAGIWRRAAIEAAGGWSASTLTEDLDLSYRAQLAGWTFVFLPDVVVPAELPGSLSAFQEQQHRWAKGSIQTARKLVPQILGSALPRPVKREALVHLTNNSAYLLTVVIAVLMVPAIVIRQRLGLTWTLLVDAAMFALSTLSVLGFYIEGQRVAGRPSLRLRELAAVLPIGIGISIRNGAAVIEGLIERGGTFHRTPKRGDSATLRLDRMPRLPLGELALAIFFAVAVVAFAAARQWVSLPFLMLFLSGYSYVAILATAELLTFGRSVS